MAKPLYFNAFAACTILLVSVGTSLAQPPAGAPGQGGTIPNNPTRQAPVGNAQPAYSGGAPAAAAPATRPSSQLAGSVALVDLGFVVKNHAGLQAKQEEFRQRQEAFQNDVKAKSEALKKLAMQSNDFAKGSKEYKELEEELAKRDSILRIDVKIAQQKFAEEEARVMYDIYQQIVAEVRLYAEANNIALVMHFNGDEANRNNPEEMVREMQMRTVLYHNRGIDITPFILDRLKGQAGRTSAPPAAARPGVPAQPRR